MFSRRLIIALRCGRLANRLVLFANWIGFAAEHQWRLINFTFHSYAEHFESTRGDIYCQFPPPAHTGLLDALPAAARLIRRTRILYHAVRVASRLNDSLPLASQTITLREKPGCEVTRLDCSEIESQLRCASTVFIHGWNFRAPSYVERHAGTIRQFFRPTMAHVAAAKRRVDFLRQKCSVVIGVHLRHGDYRAWRGGKYFFPVARYVHWMRELVGQFAPARVGFLVCSDEPRAAAEFAELNVSISNGSPVIDLHALSECDLVFGPVSSFTQWASFYGQVPAWNLQNQEESLSREKFRISNLLSIPR